MILRFALIYNRDLLIEIGRNLIEELEQLPAPRGFGGFGLSIRPPTDELNVDEDGSVSVDYDPPREYRHPDELEDLYAAQGEIPLVVKEWFESWKQFDDAAQEIGRRKGEENPKIFISVGGATFGPDVERIKGSRTSDIPDFFDHNEMEGMGGGMFTEPGVQDWRGGDPALEEE